MGDYQRMREAMDTCGIPYEALPQQGDYLFLELKSKEMFVTLMFHANGTFIEILE